MLQAKPYMYISKWTIVLMMSASLHEISGESQFSQISGANTCTCPSNIVSLTYECTVTGGLGTIWQGSAINKYCTDSGGQILLLHSRFGSETNYLIICGNGTIAGQSVGVENNNRYTSRLTITTVSSNILGDTVECAHSQNGTTCIIGNATIELHTVLRNMPLANDVHISAINFGSRQLEFIWSSVAPDCPAIHYNILASNCGSCPTTTNHTNVTCTDVPTNGSVCTFAIRSAVCGDITGNISDTVSITFYANELTGIPTDTTENQDKHNSGSTEIMGMHILAIVLIGSLAAALIVCVVVFIAVLLIILRRSKAKINAALELSNRAEGTTHDDPMYEDVTGSSPSDGIINTQDNVAYGHTQIPTLKESQH